MKKADLINKKNNKVTLIEEQKLRDLYLRKIITGEIQGPLTGYASIDKPWLKFYNENAILSDEPKCSIYDMIYENNKNYLNNNAIQYFNKYISYKELFENIEKYAKALKINDVKEGDIISVSLPNIPESVYLFYAISKIGAVANMIDPRASSTDIKYYINEVDSKLLFTLEDIMPKITEVVDEIPVNKVIKISATNALMDEHSIERKKITKSVETCNIFTFLKEGEKYQGDTKVPYKKDRAVVIEHTGGTTGTPKGVLLTNDAINMIAYHFMISNLKFKRNQKWLNIMPPFIAYGVGNGLHLPLAVGMCVVAIPKFEPNKIDELIVQYKPDNFAGVPIHYESIIRSKKLDNMDFSNWVLPGVGGDTMDIALEQEANEFLKNHNANTNVIKGYGLTEVCAAACVCFNGANELGSVGIPFLRNNIAVFDNENGEYHELGYNERGEICISSPSVMLEYFNNKEETETVLKKHSDGKYWMHTGDVGYMTEDGLIYIDGRTKRVIIRYDGFKIYPFGIEKVISSLPEVAFCKVVATPDIDHVQGNLPQANIILNNEYKGYEEKVLLKVKEACINELAEYTIPVDYNFIDEFPRTPIGKVDYVAMEEKNKAKVKRRV